MKFATELFKLFNGRCGFPDELLKMGASLVSLMKKISANLSSRNSLPVRTSGKTFVLAIVIMDTLSCVKMNY